MTAVTAPLSASAEDKQRLARQLALPTQRLGQRLRFACGGALAVVVGWAAFVPIASGAVAPGQLMVENRRKTVQHLDGGIVREIRVREGAQVRAGDVLVRLDDTDAQLSVAVYQTQADSLRAEQAARQAELTHLPEVRFPADLLARREDPDVAAILASQQAVFEARRRNQLGRKAQLGERLVQIERQIAGERSQAHSRVEQATLLEGEIADLSKLLAKGLTPKARVLALRRAAAEARGDQGAFEAAAARLRAQAAETRIERLQVEREAETDAANALRQIQSDLVSVLDKLAVARQRLGRTEIRAPVSGTVVGLSVTTVGGVIRPGDPLMDIVPTADRLVITARLSPREADDVRVGQPADVRFDAAGTRTAPVVRGTVTKVSADALADPRSGAPYFEVSVAVPQAEAAQLPPKLLKPGLPAEVLLKTGERTALGYMLSPITRASFHAMRER